MSAIEDLAQAVTDLTVSVSAELTALTAALAVVGQDAAIEASVAKLNSLNDALKASLPAPVVVAALVPGTPVTEPTTPAVDPTAPAPVVAPQA